MGNNLDIIKNLNILFVDDEVMIRQMMYDVLSDTVGHVMLATNGQEGLEMYTNSLRPFDIVISDQTMPIMNGLDMLAKIKDINPNQKCIMMTAHSEAEYMLRAIEIGIEHFLIKPIYFDKLDEIILELVNKMEKEKEKIKLEKEDKFEQINHALNYSINLIVKNIPLPSIIIDKDDNIKFYNDEFKCLIVGTPHYQEFLDKKLNFNTFKDAKSYSHLCDWKEEVIQFENDLSCTIDSNKYAIKIKKIVPNAPINMFILCLLEPLCE